MVRRIPPALWAGTIAAVFLGFTLVIHAWKGVPFSYLMQDVTVTGNLAPYAGFMSNVGILFWCATAAVCLFSSAVLAQRGPGRLPSHYLLAAGLLSMLLGLDDFFRLHESVIPRVLGIPEPVVYAGYALLLAAFLVRFRALILSASGRLLVFALACFAGSVVLDLDAPAGIDPYLVEDGLKFAGIACWFVYFVRQSWLGLTCAARPLQLAAHGGDPTTLPSLRRGAARGGGAVARR